MSAPKPLTETEAAASRKAFKELGLVDSLCDACVSMCWKEPTPIQIQAVPELLKGKLLQARTCARPGISADGVLGHHAPLALRSADDGARFNGGDVF